MPLENQSKDKWNRIGINVDLKPENDALGIDITAPKLALKQIVLEWDIPAPANAEFLCDHWERAYDDLEWQSLDDERIMP